MPVTKTSSGGGGDYERPQEGMHLAVCAHVFDVGMHDSEYKGVKKKSAKFCIVWELEAQDSKGNCFQMFDVVPASAFGNTNRLKEAIEACLRRPLKEAEIDAGFNTDAILGKCAMLTIVAGDAAKGKGDARYINRRDPLQDPKRTLKVRGKYGPAAEIPRYVYAVMKSADKGTVLGGQGLPPADKPKDGAKPEQAAAPATEGQREPGSDDGQKFDNDIPF